MKKTKELLLPIYIIFNILLILVGSYLVTIKVIKIVHFSVFHFALLIINALIIYFYIRVKHKEIKFNKLDILIILILIFGIISSIFAIHKQVAIFGFNKRNEGLVQIMYYFSILFLSTLVDKKYIKIIVYSILFCGVVEGIYAILQRTQLLPVATLFNYSKPWATGFITNPNFFGTFMLLCISYSIGLFIDNKKISLKIIDYILIVLFTVCILLSNTLSAVVGLMGVLLYVLIYTIKTRKNIINLIILIATIILLSLSITKIGYTQLLGDLIKTKDQTIEMSKGNFDDSYGTKRIFIWKNTIKRVPKYLIHGVGIDNFYYAFGKEPLSRGIFCYDKAHNEYLQVLICEGIFALISYLAFYAILLLRGIKNSFKNEEVYLILPVIGYLIQAFFNISVIEVAPFVYIALGLCIERE